MAQPSNPSDNTLPPDGLAFDEHGPSLDGVRLTRRTRKGWQPTEREILERELLNFAGLVVPDVIARLDTVCRAMDLGDFAKAAIVSEHVTRDMKQERDRRRRAASAGAAIARTGMAKASPDDPKHPGWPAETPDGKGGQFRPKDGTTSESTQAKVKRLAARRGLRSTLRRILTIKRAARIATEVLGDAIPGLDAVSGAATLLDAAKLGADLAEDAINTEAAIAFAEKGPQSVEDLQVSQRVEGFDSYSAFKKIDLEKRFGPAGDGYEYHHIVEQGPNASSLPAGQLQSTSNIVRVPRLVHEEITSYYETPRRIEGQMTTLREFLRNKNFSDQYKYGIDVLKYVGALHSTQ